MEAPGQRFKLGAGDLPVFAFQLGGSFGLVPAIGLLAFGRIQSSSTDWASMRGESSHYADLALGPELRLPFLSRRTQVTFNFAAPVGYTASGIRSGPARAVHERYGRGSGFNFGIQGGLSFTGARSPMGGYANLGWTRHSVSFDYTATLTASPGTQFKERRYVTHDSLTLTVGAFFKL